MRQGLHTPSANATCVRVLVRCAVNPFLKQDRLLVERRLQVRSSHFPDHGGGEGQHGVLHLSMHLLKDDSAA